MSLLGFLVMCGEWNDVKLESRVVLLLVVEVGFISHEYGKLRRPGCGTAIRRWKKKTVV